MFGSELPRLLTAIPGPRSVALAEELARVECPALTARRARRAERTGEQHDPISWHEASGSNVRDADGNVFVDLTGGFGAALFGHAHGPIVSAVRAQEGRLIHALGDVHPSDVKVQLLAALAALAPFPARVILGLSGADAVEAALKTAALHTQRPGVIAFQGGYHGLSHGPLAVCGYGEAFRAPFAEQLNPHVAFAQFAAHEAELPAALDSVRAAIAALAGRAGALLVEPIQGRGGVRVAAPGFLPALRALADQHGLLLIVDEIYTGLGRSGALFYHRELGCEADLICLGKSLGGGYAVSACLGRTEVMAAWGDPAGEAIHTSTFLGNPPACAAALATLELIRAQDAPAQARGRGEALSAALRAVPGVAVQGRGMLIGVRMDSPAQSPERVLSTCRALLERGYIVLPAGAPPAVLCLTPPLALNDEQIAGFAAALAAAMERP
jgi:4-aminobutyrate aminotransferase / (S)-3-amino-2-methylpropionate transaminase / 5-aminovalerate transaminase